MKIRFEMSEMMIMFAIAMLWHSVVAASCVFGFAVFCGFCRWALEVQEKAKQAEAGREAVKLLNEQAEGLGEALQGLFSGAKKKNNMNVH